MVVDQASHEAEDRFGILSDSLADLEPLRCHGGL
jgi:hypothetical protein